MTIVLFVVFFILFAALFAYAFIAKRKREKAMAELAAQRGWTALGNQPALLQQYLPQYLQGLGQNGFSFNLGTRRTTEAYDMAYQATIGNDQVVFFQYQYTEYFYGGDPNQQEQSETHYFTVLNAVLPISLPIVLLLHHSLLSKLTTFGEHTGLQHISLEGDFNKYFDTYIQPNSQVEALSLLTPDTMQLVIDAANGASMQVAGQSIILSFENRLLSPQTIEPVLDQMTKLIANITSKAQSQLQMQPQAAPTPSVVTPPTFVQPAATINPTGVEDSNTRP